MKVMPEKQNRRMKRIIKRISLLEAESGVPACIVRDLEELPPRLRSAEGVDRAAGLYDEYTNQIFIFVKQIESVREAVEVYLHELTHLTLCQGLGDEKHELLEQVYRSMPFLTKRMLRKKYRLQIKGRPGREKRFIIANEYLAILSETGPKPCWQRRLKSTLRSVVRYLFPGYRWSVSELVVLLHELKEKIKRRGPGRTRSQLAEDLLEFEHQNTTNSMGDD